MRIGVAGLGLIGASVALGLRAKHEIRGYDVSNGVRGAARRRGIAAVDALDELLPADAVVIATPVEAVVPTLDALAERSAGAVLIEVGSVKGAVAVYAAGAPASVRIVGLHPMAGGTATGPDAADPALLDGRPFLLVPTARTDARARATAEGLARDLGGRVVECSAEDHDRAVAVVSGLPLASAVAIARVARARSPIDLDLVAGPGLQGATRLAATSPELALALLGAPGLREHLVALRGAIGELEAALGDDVKLRALLERAATDRPA